ncbi:MAG: hypothetical protein IKZ98_00215 [Clostridia bacterium]|nr:hypothetical protein [Clostridia bacterium]
METTDVLERTLAQEKTRYDKFCRMMHVLSTLLCILFTAGAFFCLIVSTVQFIQYSNQGGETNIISFTVPVLYLFLVLGGIGLLWNSARHIFRRLRSAETPFCYDIADKIKGAGFLAMLLGVIWGIYRTMAELLIKNGRITLIWEPEGFRELGYTFIFSVIILGMVLMMTAYVFNYGCKLQQESDETL